MRHRCLATLALLFALPVTGLPANIDLSTVPDRDTVQLTIYNSEDLTLVRETRKVSFKPGVNPLQFSWANTLIDPTSVELRFLTDPDKLVVLDTTFPHDKPQMLYWSVQSELDGEAMAEITYFTSGITWSADYVLVADRAEEQASFEGFVRVTNNSGEEYEEAQVRLVVGTINLVEKIAQLAQVPISDVGNLERAERDAFTKRAMVLALDDRSGGMGGGEVLAEKPKEIIKEGLSEYFIYTIEGTETIPHSWSKRMRSFEGQTVPFRIQYRYRPEEYGDQLVRMYLLANDEQSKLGTTPLPDGVVRVFRDNGRDGLSFLAAQPIKYVPIGDKIELNLGPDPQVFFELVKRRVIRDQIWLQINGTETFKRVGGNDAEIEEQSSVAGWDEHTQYVQRIRNYTARPIEVEVGRSFDGHVVFRSGLEPVLHDYRTVRYTTRAPASTTVNLPYEVVIHQGRNAKQNNVTLEPAEQP
jgi:hypothetical protein